MARKAQTVYEITDDLSGEVLSEEEAVHVEFTYGGAEYELDLSPANAKKLDDFLAPYIDAVGPKRRVRQTAASAKTRTEKRDLTAIREWATKNGHSVAPRGRVAQDILDAYEAAQ
jgi:hypothetical protein